MARRLSAGMRERANFVRDYFADHYHGGGQAAVRETMRDAQAAYKGTRTNPAEVGDVGAEIGAGFLGGAAALIGLIVVEVIVARAAFDRQRRQVQPPALGNGY